jgi:RNA polymerase sigma factor (sigma-70 family)
VRDDALDPSSPLSARWLAGNVTGAALDADAIPSIELSTEPAPRATSQQGLAAVKLGRRRDDDEFDEVFRALLPRAKRVAYRILGDITDAEDAAVEALARASLRWRRLSPLPDAQRDAWVLRVTANVAYDEVRRRIRRQRPLPLDVTDTQQGEKTIDLRDSVVGALAELPRRQKEVLTLRYIGDLSEVEIATALGVSPGTVKSCASRGLAALRQQGFEWKEAAGASD